MKKYLLGFIFIILLSGCVTLSAKPLQQPVFNKELYTVTYMDILYYYDSHIVGIAGYNTIDKMVPLRKTIFISKKGSKIHMVEIIEQEKKPVIVGFGISIRNEYSIEDTDCDGIFETVRLYNDLVFPPDCFSREKI